MNPILERDIRIVKRWRDLKTGPHHGRTYDQCIRDALINLNACNVGEIDNLMMFGLALHGAGAECVPTSFGGWIIHGDGGDH